MRNKENNMDYTCKKKIFTKATARGRHFVFTGIALRVHQRMITFCDRNCTYISCWPLEDVCCNI